MIHVALRRRRVLILVGSMALLLAAPARRITARLRAITHQPLPPDLRSLDPLDVRRVCLLTGALFGHRLDERELADVSDDLTALNALDGGWRAEFSRAAAWIDRRARAHGAHSFDAAPDDVRDAVVDDIMRAPVLSWQSRVRATIDTDERVRRRMRGELVGALATMYMGSAVSWRRRGYARRPGEGGDPTEYTRAGVAGAC